MATERPSGLLGPDDPVPVICSNVLGGSPFLLTGDHAGHAIPSGLGTLGLCERDRARHIAVDIGVAGLGEALAARLDAMFVSQVYSRLVIDCNRDPLSAEAIPSVSDGTPVPGNAELNEAQRAARIGEIHEPYHARIATEIAARSGRSQETVIIALHSFTPVLAGEARPWHVGILHEGGDEAFARRLLEAFSSEPGLHVGDNQPYHLDSTDYSVPRHAFSGALPYAEVEVRQDLIGDEAGQRHWAELLSAALERARL